MKEIRYDLDSFEVLTNALMDLLNQYPLLDEEEIAFSMLDPEEGIAMFPTSGPVILKEDEDITGMVEQTCAYPFTIVYRAAGLSSRRKINIKELLDNLGKWLERQPIKVGDETYVLANYPDLTEGRKIKSISRTSPGYLFSTSEDKVEDWMISIQATYENKFEKL